jgi:hypothetical protein
MTSKTPAKTPAITYKSQKQDGKLSVQAIAVVATPPGIVLQAHKDQAFASAFRDIGRYTMFQNDGDVIRTAYSSRLSFLSIPMAVNKRVSPQHGDSGGYVDFWTPPSAMASFRGRWTVQPHIDGGSAVSVTQTIDLPAWSRFLPVESAVEGRVRRAFEDLAALGS